MHGNLLSDSSLIKDIPIKSHDIIHLIGATQIENINANENHIDSNGNNNQMSLANSLINGIIALRMLNMNLLQEIIERERNLRLNENIFSSNITDIISARNGINFRNDLLPRLIDLDEIREVILQNLVGVQSLIRDGNYIEKKELTSESKRKGRKKYNMKFINLNKRTFTKAQWIDVKNIFQEWEEAQIIDISEKNKMIKVHYNQLETFYDEWIKTNSPRIMPFRYHTKQFMLTNYHSPFPKKSPDTGISLLKKPFFQSPADEQRQVSTDFHLNQNFDKSGFLTLFNEFGDINKVMQGLIEKLLMAHNDKNQLNRKEKINVQNILYYNLRRLIPILDRIGRIYCDISRFFDSCIKMDKLELISENIFGKNKENNEILNYSFSNNEQLRINTGLHNLYLNNISRTSNSYPHIKQFESQLNNSMPNLDTPVIIGMENPNIHDFRNNLYVNYNSRSFNQNNSLERFNIEYIGHKDGKKNRKMDNILGAKTKRKNIMKKK